MVLSDYHQCTFNYLQGFKDFIWNQFLNESNKGVIKNEA